MPPSTLTAEQYQQTIDLLRGQRIAMVVYYPLSEGSDDDDGTVAEDWDYGLWHQPTMGVELLTERGDHFSAVWGSSFDYYGLEVFPAPMTQHLVNIGEPGSSLMVDVTAHPRWAGIVDHSIVSADVVWLEDATGAVRFPVSLRLRSQQATLWIAAGRPAAWPPGDDLYLGTDDVMVIFIDELATKVGIPDPPR